MIRFHCDYAEGAHPRILQKLLETNLEQSVGYGEDESCREAAGIIRGLCQAPQAAVHFLVGGTQANLTVLAAALRPWQGVLAADTGHIAAHESGAIEATGHKVLTLPNKEGKISAEQIEGALKAHWEDSTHEHMVMPGAVYLSHPTEFGTLYSQAEMRAIRQVCDRFHLILYLDGARLGYGLAAGENDLTLPFLAECADAFTIGGTKQGALFGEAVVISHPELNKDFRYLIKQRGGMLAKGWLLGIQFVELLRDGLYFSLSEHAVRLAMKLRAAFRECGIPFWVESPTNQQFPILADEFLERLSRKYSYSEIARVSEGRLAVRFCTSWATGEEAVDQLIEDIRRG